MFKGIYVRLALSNLKKNKKNYLPYIITSILTIMIFYDMYMITINPGLKKIPGSASVISVLGVGAYIVGIFACIFLFYTNSFLVKQRKKEIGLYNVLGMGKKDIGFMMFWETVITSIGSLICGLLAGVLFGKLMFLILYRILRFKTEIIYEISGKAIQVTVVLFVAIFAATLLANLWAIRRANPIELLKGGAQGEREPKTKLILALFGVVTIAAGYVLANTVENPITAISVFFLAVLLVVCGTYALFVAGSIAVLKLMRKNKNFYYKANHFHSVSGMIYRMKQNGVGLANICILSTMVLITVSTTVCLNMGMENIMSNRFPKEFMLNIYEATEENIQKVDKVITEEVNRFEVQRKNAFRCAYLNLIADENEKGFDSLLFEGAFYSNKAMLEIAPVRYYNEMCNDDIELSDGEAVVYTVGKENYGKDTLSIEDMEFTVVKEPDRIPMEKEQEFPLMDTYVIFVKDESVIHTMIENYAKGKPVDITYECGFDLSGSLKAKQQVADQIETRVHQEMNLSGGTELRGNFKEDFYTFYGCFLFIGIFLGSLFLMATVLIIYYKQISEGYEDRNRYQIMKKVGMSRKEIRKTINSQIRLVFFLPIGVAVVHVIAAFRLMRKILATMNLTNMNLFIACTAGTILVFAVIYMLVFKITAREYYKIVTK